MIYRREAVLARFRYPQRQGEEPFDAAWLERTGFTVRRLAEGVFFEGAGDALFCGDTLFAGYRIRSDVRGHQQIGAVFSCRVIPLELVDPYYYHLDTCFCPLAPGRAIYYPGAFDDYGRKALAEAVDELIEVSDGRSPAVRLQRRGDRPHRDHQHRLRRVAPGARQPPASSARATALDEFVKAGGSAKCLTLRLDGEEAASWKHPGSS